MAGRITKRGDCTVRTLLYEAANVLLVKISRTSSLRDRGLAIAQRSGFKKAKIAVARKIAVLLHRPWRDGTDFRWSAAPAAARAARARSPAVRPRRDDGVERARFPE